MDFKEGKCYRYNNKSYFKVKEVSEFYMNTIWIFMPDEDSVFLNGDNCITFSEIYLRYNDVKEISNEEFDSVFNDVVRFIKNRITHNVINIDNTSDVSLSEVNEFIGKCRDIKFSDKSRLLYLYFNSYMLDKKQCMDELSYNVLENGDIKLDVIPNVPIKSEYAQIVKDTLKDKKVFFDVFKESIGNFASKYNIKLENND
jgi:hypothetical protein